MAGSLQPRVKTWVSLEDVVYSDLNAEFDNVLLAMQPLLIDDYSTDVTQMQVTADPGEVGTESKATTLAGEVARLRHMIREMSGEDEWYESPVSSLLGLSNAIGTGLTDNRIVSGRVLTTSAQPAFLVPNGAAKTVKVDGTPTNFIYYVDGVEYTITTDVTLTGLTAAPSSNNTCLVNDAVAADQYWTKYAGEDGSEIPVDNMGSEISALIGKFAAFKLAGSTDEYFFGYVESATRLTKCRRGYFFDSADAPVPRAAYTNNDTITLMKLTWVFAKTDLTLTATYNNPVWSDDEPSSPALGDYWFDLSANTWKVYGIGSYAVANATLVGICLQDATNTIAARSFEFFKNYDELNTIELIYESASQVKSRFPGGTISAWGTTVKNEYGVHTWDMTLDLESGVTEAASTYYYFYLTETGDKIISNKKPHDRREDLLGYYHPSQSWRCVGWAFNNASSNLEQVESYYHLRQSEVIRSVIATDYLIPRDRVILLSGASFTEYLPAAALSKGNIYTFVHNGTSLTQVYTLDGFGSETIGGATTYGLYTNGEVLKLISDGSNWLVLDHHAQTAWVNFGLIPITGSTSDPTKASTTVTDNLFWRRNGSDALIRAEYRRGANTSAAAGSGDYLFAVPTNLTIDTTLVTANATEQGAGVLLRDSAVGSGFVSNGSSNDCVSVTVWDSTKVTLSNSAACVSSANYPLNNITQLVYLFEYRVPITGWKP